MWRGLQVSDRVSEAPATPSQAQANSNNQINELEPLERLLSGASMAEHFYGKEGESPALSTQMPGWQP